MGGPIIEDSRFFGRPFVRPFFGRPFVGRPFFGRPFFGSPFVGGLLGGLVGSALFNPYFYGGYPYPYWRPFYPYGGFWF